VAKLDLHPETICQARQQKGRSRVLKPAIRDRMPGFLGKCEKRHRAQNRRANGYGYILQVQDEGCPFCGGCQVRSKALDSGSSKGTPLA